MRNSGCWLRSSPVRLPTSSPPGRKHCQVSSAKASAQAKEIDTPDSARGRWIPHSGEAGGFGV